MLKIPHYLDNRLTDDIEIVSSTHPPSSTLQKHYFSASGIHLRSRKAENTAVGIRHADHVAPSIRKSWQ
jgi:hypothetical protein